jgi:single-stranded-DNA-specific exonuclease
VAGHIKEKYYRPTFVLTDGETCVKGSGRSIESYSMFEKMNECRELILKFGGHPMAAGLSLQKENIDAFRSYLNEHSGLSEEDLNERIHIDVKLPLSYLSENLISQMDLLEPFGNKNEKPSFADKNVFVKKITYIGNETKYFVLFKKNVSKNLQISRFLETFYLCVAVGLSL